LDGSYLHCDKRIADASPLDTIAFNQDKRDMVKTYLGSGEAKAYLEPLNQTEELIDGFQSPLGLEVLATVDWLLVREGCQPTVDSIRSGLRAWPAGADAGQRKLSLFDARMLELSLERLTGKKF
jgi:hypothetical protein